jgi:branched-chain amino acid transport system permease protein
MSMLRNTWIKAWPLVGLVLLISVLSALLATGGGEVRAASMTGLLDVVIVIGLYVFVGNSGVMSFGHIGFVAIGAYTSALITIPAVSKSLLLPDLPGFLGSIEVSMWASFGIAAVVAMLVAAVLSVPLMRLSGIAAAIATLALLVIVGDVLSNYKALTGGQGTLTGVPTDLTVGSAALLVVIALAVAFAFQMSRFGLRLRAARDDEVAARSLGIAVENERRIAFVVSAGISGAGGAGYAHYVGSLAPDQFYLQLTFLILAMLILGGMYSLAGAVLGATLLSTLSTVLDRLEGGEGVGPLQVKLPANTREVAVAVILLAVLFLRPNGVMGGRELSWPRVLGGRRPQDDFGPPPPGEPAGSALVDGDPLSVKAG